MKDKRKNVRLEGCSSLSKVIKIVEDSQFCGDLKEGGRPSLETGLQGCFAHANDRKDPTMTAQNLIRDLDR